MSANAFFGIKTPKRKCCLFSMRFKKIKVNEPIKIKTGVEFIEKK